MLGDTVFKQISSGAGHTCGINTTGHAFCWGERLAERVIYTCMQPAALRVMHMISMMCTHGCNVGINLNGRLGDGTTTDRNAPTRVSGDTVLKMISLGADHTVALAGGPGELHHRTVHSELLVLRAFLTSHCMCNRARLRAADYARKMHLYGTSACCVSCAD